MRRINVGKLIKWALMILCASLLAMMLIPAEKIITPELLMTFPLAYDMQERYPEAFARDAAGTKGELWFPVSERPYTESSAERLHSYIGDVTLDFDRYTYAVSFGCTISYIRKAEYLLGSETFEGYTFGEATAELSADCPGNQGYLYRMPKDWIDIKYYERFDGNYRFAQ
ncbi:MAG: hypothetical protein IKK21_00275 [Clostridia bacterium]|nr:hypothetical protein [Clostridia bacterium]